MCERRLIYVSVVCLLTTFLTLNAIAQNSDEQGQLYYVLENKVKPPKVAQYEAAIKEFVASLRQNNLLKPYIAIQADDFTYSYVMRVDDPADPNPRLWEKLAAKIGEEATDAIGQKFEGTVDWTNTYLLRRRYDLSYTPEQKPPSDEPMTFGHYDTYNFETGKMDEAIAIVKEWAEMMKENKIDRGYRLYLGDIGTEGNMMLIAQNAKDAADYYTYVQKRNELLGEEKVNKLVEKVWAITRKFEHENGTVRADLSHLPSEVLTTKQD